MTKELPPQLCRYSDGSIHSGFVIWQKIYADHGRWTFPVGPSKVPLVRGWNKVGPYLSAQWAQQFPFAPAVGVLLGASSRITELDVDSTDARVLADALDRHGHTPIVIRTASGKFKAWHRHNGEKRRTRNHTPASWPWPGLPIDLLGGGFTVAPASFNADYRQYEIIQGSLDDLDQLPVMQNLEQALYRTAKDERAKKANSLASPLKGMVEGDGRNDALFHAIGRPAREIYAEGGTRDRLFEVAMSYNQESAEPMAVEEVNNIVGQVWQYTVEGHNYIRQRGAFMQDHEVDALIDRRNQDAFLLLAYLRVHQGPSAEFMITNSLNETFCWRVERLVAARNRLIELGYVRLVKPAWSRSPALYKWRGYLGTQKR